MIALTQSAHSKVTRSNTPIFGDHSKAVQTLQSNLNHRFQQFNLLSVIYVTVDGVFGPQTRNAVKYLQCIGGLRVDGQVGPKTLAFIHQGIPGLPILKLGSKGSGVHALQLMLKRMQFTDLVIDGIFGEKTERALKSMQQRFSLVPDGIVGPQTWRPIVEARFFSLPCAMYSHDTEFLSS